MISEMRADLTSPVDSLLSVRLVLISIRSTRVMDVSIRDECR